MSENKKYTEEIFSNFEKLTLKFIKFKSKNINTNFKMNSNGTSDMSERQYQILFIVGYFEVNNVTEIAKTLGQSVSSTSLLMTKLTKNGYLQKKYAQEGEDNRKVSFLLTDAGEERFKTLTAFMINNVSSKICELSNQQKNDFLHACSVIYEILPTKRDFNIFNATNLKEKNLENPTTDIEISAYALKTFLNFAIVANEHFCKNFSKIDENAVELTKKQFNILYLINKGYASNVTELSKKLHVSESSLSTSVTKLSKDKLVIKSRGEDLSDSRKIKLSLTEAGKLLLENKAKQSRENAYKLLNLLSDEVAKTINDAIFSLEKTFSILEK